MLTRKVALSYLTETLQVKEVEKKLKGDKLVFLNEIIGAQLQHVPYHTFDMIATEPQNRSNPSLQECIDSNLNQTGGVCVTLQAFFFKLLQVLDLTTHVVAGDVPTGTIRDNHPVIIVKDVQEIGDEYYVDVGMSYPTLTAIPLHNLKDGESELHQFHFLNVRISREGRTYTRSHKRRDNNGGYYWDDFIRFQPDMPKDFNYFDVPMHIVYTDEVQSNYLKNCYAALYPSDIAITVKNLTVKIWHKETKTIEQIDFDSIDKACEKVSELFPMIPFDTIKKGYQDWQKWEQRNSGKPKESYFNVGTCF